MKYEITHTCGHEITHDLTGKVRDRDSRMTWLKMQPCLACKNAAENAQAAAAAAAAGLPALVGTDRQVAWATTIRQRLIDSCGTFMADRIAAVGRQYPDQVAGVVAVRDAMQSWLASQTVASWWIDRRDSQPVQILGEAPRTPAPVVAEPVVAPVAEAPVVEAVTEVVEPVIVEVAGNSLRTPDGEVSPAFLVGTSELTTEAGALVAPYFAMYEEYVEADWDASRDADEQGVEHRSTGSPVTFLIDGEPAAVSAYRKPTDDNCPIWIGPGEPNGRYVFETEVAWRAFMDQFMRDAHKPAL